MERLALTGAELAFVLSLAERSWQEQAWSRLRMPPEDHTDAVVRGGLSSLTVRGLVVGNGSEITLSPAVATVLQGLTEPTLWVSINAITAEAVDAAHLYVHRSGAFLLSPRAYGCFDVQGIRRDVAPSEIVGSVARRFLTDRQPAIVTCEMEPAVGEGSVALIVSPDGAVSVVIGATTTPAATIDDALRSFGYALAAGSPAMAAAVPQ